MRILSLTHKPPYPPKDGGAIGILNIATGIALNSNKIHILSMNTVKHKVTDNDIPNRLDHNLSVSFVNIDTTIRPIKALFNLLFSKLPYSATRFISKNYLASLTQILKNEEYDFIQLEGPFVWYCLPTIRKYSKARISLRSHNIEHEIWKRLASIEHSLLKKWYFKILAKRMYELELKLINQYDFIVPVTARDLEFFTKNGNIKPSMVMPAGIILKNIPETFSPLQINCLFSLGALDWMPNQEAIRWFAEHVWEQVKAKYNNLEFHVAGRNAPDWMKEYLENKNITFHGEIENASEFMLQYGIMLVPLFSGSGLRVKIIEGMALGRAIISTTIGAEGIDYTEGKDILIANTPDEFLQKISMLLDNSSLASQIGNNARILATNKYDVVKITKELIDFYCQ